MKTLHKIEIVSPITRMDGEIVYKIGTMPGRYSSRIAAQKAAQNKFHFDDKWFNKICINGYSVI